MPASKKKPTKKKKLTKQQRLFVAEYTGDPKRNQTQAAIRAKYSEKTATVTAARLLTYVHVQEAVEDAMRAQEKRIEITSDRILQELAIIAFSDPKHYIEIQPDGTVRVLTLDEIDGPAARAIKEVKGSFKIAEEKEGEGKRTILYSDTEYKLHDKMKALELLGKNKALFTDKLVVEGGPFVIVKRDYKEETKDA